MHTVHVYEINEVLGKKQQSIYSIKTADKVGKVTKTTYLPVANQHYFPQILMFYPRFPRKNVTILWKNITFLVQ